MTVKHLLEQKDRNLWTIDPDATVLDALAKMAEKDIGSLVVMDGEELIGIITERHYSRNVILNIRASGPQGILASAAGTNPVPQGLDFLRRLAGACVLRDAEASGDGIRKIVARRQLRLRENAKAQ